MGNRVPRVRTAVSENELSQAIIQAWQQLFSSTPTKEQVTMVMAHNALETGHRKSMWNYNLGNITTNGKGSYNYFDDLTTDEQMSPGKWEKKNLKYRAYPNLLEGTKDYLKFLSGEKYANAWQFILNPDPASFSKALKEVGYYTANEAPYTKHLTSVYNSLSKNKEVDNDKDLETLNRLLDETDDEKTEALLNKLFNQTTKSDSVKPPKPSPKPVSKPSTLNTEVLDVVNNYLQQVAASEKNNKALYQKYLTNNNCLIKINSNNVVNSIEFGRVLCAVLEEELMASASVHMNNHDIEVSCDLQGPSHDCFQAVQELTASLVDTFRRATLKIGGVKVQTKLSMNKKSSYQLLNAKVASEYYDKFLSKFKGN